MVEKLQQVCEYEDLMAIANHDMVFNRHILQMMGNDDSIYF